MSVVSNTSPLNYLVLIGADHILPERFGTIAIPTAVRDELSDPGTPASVRAWIALPPDWLDIHTVEPVNDVHLDALHRGEREAILLAEKLNADLIILDEHAARTIAQQRGLPVAGTLGVLNEAGTHGLIDIPEATHRLRHTSFRAAPSLYKWLLDQHRQRQAG